MHRKLLLYVRGKKQSKTKQKKNKTKQNNNNKNAFPIDA